MDIVKPLKLGGASVDRGENIKYGLDFIETVKPLTRVISKLLPSVSTVTALRPLHALSPPRLG